MTTALQGADPTLLQRNWRVWWVAEAKRGRLEVAGVASVGTSHPWGRLDVRPLPACWAVWMSDTSLVGALCVWQRMLQWAALCRWEFATRVLCAHLCRLELSVPFTWNGFSYPRGKRTALYPVSQGNSSFQMPFIVIHWSQWEMGT